MNTDLLFDIPPQDSPRLAWIKRINLNSNQLTTP